MQRIDPAAPFPYNERLPVKKKTPVIPELASAVFDNGRRGAPRPGCDCEQCFGYCHIDRNEVERQSFRPAPKGGEE